MSSIWSSGASGAGTSPFATTGMAPTPGGGRAAKFQAALQSMGKAQPANASKSQAGSQVGNQTATQPGLSPAATSSGVKSMDSSGGTADASGSTISANDFLTLLVTEMQNQDPTAQTDPNEYINPLVQINSLEQLISINQNLATVLGAASSQTTPTTGSAASGLGANAATSATAGTQAAARTGSVNNIHTSHVPAAGNLSLPTPSPASRTVAHALDGHPRPGQLRTGQTGHAIRDIPTHPMQQ